MSNERNLKNYTAGAGLCFGIVLLTFQIVNLILTGKTAQELEAINNILTGIFIGMHLLGGFIGSYLVTRRVFEDHFQVGIVTVVLAYIFESFYFIIFGNRWLPDIWVIISLLVGGVIAAYLVKSKQEKEKQYSVLTNSKSIENPSNSETSEDKGKNNSIN